MVPVNSIKGDKVSSKPRESIPAFVLSFKVRQ